MPEPGPAGVSGSVEEDVAVLGDGDSVGSECGLAAIITELSDGDEVGGAKIGKNVGSARCCGEARDV